ncbi:MAG: hypothetical protein LAO09_03180 [Acidobacteriia bacterium]|nr:hypothetical protein [Terriglobia bacterium]
MFRQPFPPVLNRILAVASLILLSATLAWSGSYKVLHDFSGRLAKIPSSGLVLDAKGNAYGTTAEGGFHAGKGGTVYQLSPQTGFNIIYGFSGPDGMTPRGNLAIDADGNLYGTTVSGGGNKTGCNGAGCGTVFRLSPPTNGGTWTQTVLYSFKGGDDGANPQAGVVVDSAGNLYGTAMNGGTNDFGTVFQLAPGPNDTWVENLVHTFAGNEGGLPQGGLIFDAAGNLYGTSGATVFEITPTGGGWSFIPLYFFNPRNGDAAGAETGVIFDANGNLFGTSSFGGAFNLGTVFELTQSQGSWTEAIIHSFAGGSDGAKPESGLVLDSAGNLYGTTFAGGGNGCSGNGCGTLFELIPGQGGQWTERRFSFPGGVPNRGVQPASTPLLAGGHIYGTTSAGGSEGAGVAFRIIP